jgi:PKD repeat protein
MANQEQVELRTPSLYALWAIGDDQMTLGLGCIHGGCHMLVRQASVALVAVLLIAIAMMTSPVGAGQVRLSWDAPATNEDGTPLTDLAGYMLYYGRTSGQQGGSYEFSVDVGHQTTYTLSGLEDGQVYYFSVTAYDISDNESDYSNEMSAVPSPDPPMPSGLTAAYSFDEGNGTVVADASGNGHTGTIAGATWTAQGRFGSALVFDGINDWITVNDAPSLDLATGMTLSAWVSPTAPLTDWRTLIAKEQLGGVVYYLHASSDTNQPAMGVFIGSERILSGGTQLTANTWTHLAATYDGSMQRLYINGVEVASRSQTGQIQASDGALRIGGNSIWGEYFQGRIDEVRIYNRALTVGEIQQDMSASVTPPPVAAPIAEFSASPTVGPAPLAVTFTDASTGGITAWSWAFGDGGTSTAQHPSHTYSAPGTYTVSLTVTGPGGSDSEVKTNYITVPPNSSGLVAAYNFNEGAGTTARDASSNGNHGTIAGATWTNQGKFGSALVFDGIDDWVTISDANSLDLTTGLTLSAWVYPTATPTGWRTLIQKEQSGGAIYYLHANSDTNRPATGVYIGAERILRGGARLSANAWTHVAATYDGARQRLYLNGIEVASRAQTGQIQVSTGALRIGGNSIWGEFFQGRIDEVRLYNRALSASEIQAAMNTPVP